MSLQKKDKSTAPILINTAVIMKVIINCLKSVIISLFDEISAKDTSNPKVAIDAPQANIRQ
jgi:hypothetical protein